MNLVQEPGWSGFGYPSTKINCAKILEGFNTRQMEILLVYPKPLFQLSDTNVSALHLLYSASFSQKQIRHYCSLRTNCVSPPTHLGFFLSPSISFFFWCGYSHSLGCLPSSLSFQYVGGKQDLNSFHLTHRRIVLVFGVKVCTQSLF